MGSRSTDFVPALIAALVLPAALSAAEKGESVEAEPAAGSTGPVADGEGLEGDGDWRASLSMLEEYRLRRASNVLVDPGQLGVPIAPEDQTDQQLRLQTEAQIEGADGHFRGVLSGVLWNDLDGRPQRGTPNLFVTQYADRQPWVAPYALWVEWHDAGVLDHARVGRQDAEHGMPLTFDGASVGIRPMGPPLLLFAFGGQTVHFFETIPGLLENWVGSTGAVIRPSPSVQLELDGRIIREQVPVFDTGQRFVVTDHSYGLAASTRTDSVFAKLYVRGLDAELSHAGGAIRFHPVSLGFGIDARIDTQLATLNEVAESENPFFSLLGPSLPYARYLFEAWKELELGGEALWSLHAGWRGRQLISDDPQPFNRNSGGIYLHTRFDDFLLRGLFVGATAEYDFVPGSTDESSFVILGGSTGYRGSTLKAEVGTYYQRFKVNYYQRAEELEDARSVFASAAYRLADWLEVGGRYELEVIDRYLESFSLTARQDF